MNSIRGKLRKLLGEWPAAAGRPAGTVVKSEKVPGGTLETLRLELNGMEPVPACFAYPDRSAGKIPAILFNHSHGGRYAVGKAELSVGAPYMNGPYLADLLNAGYAVLAIDHWGFGERFTRTESAIFKDFLWHGRVMWGMMVFDSLRALTYLETRPEVDPARIGTLGMSMGSTMAWYLAALDDRIKVCVDICCLTDFESLIAANGLDFHGIYYYVPGLLREFDTAKINALIAPRPHLSLAGTLDVLTPEAGLDKIDRELRAVYRRAGAPGNWRLEKYPVPHLETPAMRRSVLRFLAEKL